MFHIENILVSALRSEHIVGYRKYSCYPVQGLQSMADNQYLLSTFKCMAFYLRKSANATVKILHKR